MKKRVFYQLLVVAVFCLSIGKHEVSIAQEFSKTYSKDFAVKDGTELTIQNQFGKITIENWEKKSIYIEVVVTVGHRNQGVAQRMLDGISIDLKQDKNVVSGTTQIDEKARKRFGNVDSGSTKQSIQIDYRIKMPSNIDATLSNRYGDVLIEELTGLTKINLKYGNLQATKISYPNKEPHSTIDIAYGNATINEADWLRVNMKYSNMNLLTVNTLLVHSKYSNISLTQAELLIAEAKYDSYRIAKIHNLVANAGYSNFAITNLYIQLNFEGSYTGVKINNVGRQIQQIDFQGSYGNFSAPIPRDVTYLLDANVVYGKIKYGKPADVQVTKTQNDMNIKVVGTVGRKPSENKEVVVKVRNRYGDITLE